MDTQFRNYLINEAKLRRNRFLKCDGVVYEVNACHFTTGDTPIWAIDIVVPVEIKSFRPVFHSPSAD